MDKPYTLAIVGAGISALSALRAGLSSERTILLDYQEKPGGFLRPALPARGFEDYATLIQTSRLPGQLTACFNATAVGLAPAIEDGEPHTLLVRHRSGVERIRAYRLLLACGGLELTREQAQIPGSRPAGIMTPALAHQLLNRGYAPGQRIVVYGSSRYTLATARRLARAGLFVTLVHSPGLPDASILIDPSPSLNILPPAQLISLAGFPRLERLTFSRTPGESFSLLADTLVYGTEMRANTGWLKSSGLALSEQGAIKADQHYLTSVPGIYAIGTLVSPSLDHTDSLRMGREFAALFSEGSL